MSDLVYLYGFVPEPVRALTEPLTGMAGRPVELLPVNGFSAVVSYVDSTEYDRERVEQQLQDLRWVAEQGIAHERVVAWFVDQTQILPAALFTLYSNGQSLRAAAEARGELIAAELQRLSGQREWDLKVAYDASVLAQEVGRLSSAVQDIDRDVASAAPGRKFLLERKRAELTKTEVARAAAEQAQSILDALEPLCSETRALPLPQASEPLPVVLHAALLVAREQEEAIVALLEQERSRVDGTGISIGFSGPWAPYRFVKHESA